MRPSVHAGSVVNPSAAGAAVLAASVPLPLVTVKRSGSLVVVLPYLSAARNTIGVSIGARPVRIGRLGHHFDPFGIARADVRGE